MRLCGPPVKVSAYVEQDPLCDRGQSNWSLTAPCWSKNGEYTGVDKAGVVSVGIVAMAVAAHMDIQGAEGDTSVIWRLPSSGPALTGSATWAR